MTRITARSSKMPGDTASPRDNIWKSVGGHRDKCPNPQGVRANIVPRGRKATEGGEAKPAGGKGGRQEK